ncbi:MAG: phosphoribosylformylglycinamidine synthase subunit PurQ [Planctomycetota bacterium]|nr:phosphoribosylformylglycinamidine synthase subunit PurQ [Planctomycetota bacterium]
MCDASGLVLGLMPHPERFLHWNRHPRFTRLDEAQMQGPPPGLAMFQNAVAHVAACV